MNTTFDAPGRPRPFGKPWRMAMSAIAVLGLCVGGLIASPIAAADWLPSPSPAPTGGTPGWQDLAQQCQQGSMRACDSLADQTRYANAPIYYNYGFTCGGRVIAPTASSHYIYCLDQFPNNP
jgi:hypothetical protein